MSERVIDDKVDDHSCFLGLLEESHNQTVTNMSDENEGFDEPILRCDSCNKIVVMKTIRDLGLCNHCGNKRFRPVDVISELELMQIKKLDRAETFLKLFEECDEIKDNLLTSTSLLSKLAEVSNEK